MRDAKGQFVKGHTEGVRFGDGQSLGSKEKYKKISAAQKGKTISQETKDKLSVALKGHIPWNKGTEGVMKPNSGTFKKGLIPWNTGVGDISKENELQRKREEYKLWRKAVFERDKFTCQKYGVAGGKIVAHHINNFADFPELRTAIDNGITLSEKAHKQFHRKYGYKNNSREQLLEFLGNPDD